MDDTQRYEFDRQGWLRLPGFLGRDDVAALAAAVERLTAHALERVGSAPRVRSPWMPAIEYHRDDELGYHATGGAGEGATLMIEDFWNADAAFDRLVGHAPTLAVARELVRDRPTINNSEIRIRYRGNRTGSHMGGPLGHKYRYAASADGFDCMMIRFIYFLHPVRRDDGAFMVVPGTHKGARAWPYATATAEEDPGAIPVEADAGDVVLFTEHLRHGGYVNRSARPRSTIHVGYGPYWMRSQNIATADEPQHLLPATRARWTADQRALFAPYAEAAVR